MRLKALVTASFVLGLLGLLSWPWVVARPTPGPDAPLAERNVYAVRVTLYTVGLIVLMGGTAIGALILVRRARQEYRRQSRENFENLIEGLREDARRKEKHPR